MSDVFKPEDFQRLAVEIAHCHASPAINAQGMASRANDLIKERGTVVYLDPGGLGGIGKWMHVKQDYSTHSALLICVEPIVRESEERQLIREVLDRFEKHYGFSQVELNLFLVKARRLLAKGE